MHWKQCVFFQTLTKNETHFDTLRQLSTSQTGRLHAHLLVID